MCYTEVGVTRDPGARLSVKEVEGGTTSDTEKVGWMIILFLGSYGEILVFLLGVVKVVAACKAIFLYHVLCLFHLYLTKIGQIYCITAVIWFVR